MRYEWIWVVSGASFGRFRQAGRQAGRQDVRWNGLSVRVRNCLDGSRESHTIVNDGEGNAGPVGLAAQNQNSEKKKYKNNKR